MDGKLWTHRTDLGHQWIDWARITAAKKIWKCTCVCEWELRKKLKLSLHGNNFTKGFLASGPRKLWLKFFPHPPPPPLFEKTTLSHKYASFECCNLFTTKVWCLFSSFFTKIAQVLIFPFKGLDIWTDPICSSTLSQTPLDTLTYYIVLNGNNA